MKKMKTLCGLVCLLLCVALCACSSNTSGKTVDVKAAMDEIQSTYEFSDVNEVTDNMLMSVYGIDQKDVKSYAGLTDASGIQATDIMLVEATDSDAAETVRAALQARLDNRKSQMKDYLPDVYATLEKSKVTVSGNYVALICDENQDKILSLYEGSFK
ncbi:MAG: DUF4358 domain-containing protein [Acutalibacteraceae bacterium]